MHHSTKPLAPEKPVDWCGVLWLGSEAVALRWVIEMPRCLPTINDVMAACIERLAGASIERMTCELKAVSTILETVGLPDFAETDPATVEIMDALRRPDDRRSSWGQLMALVAVLSYWRGDMPSFWRAGHEVLSLHAQTQRGKKRAYGGDTLSAWIDAFLAEHPGAETGQIVSEIIGQVGIYPAFADFDPIDEVLTYQPRLDAEELRDIAIPATIRRIQRAIQRQQPASVA